MTAIGATTGRTEVRRCNNCERNVAHVELRFRHRGDRGTAWLPTEHVAMCGLPCALGPTLLNVPQSVHSSRDCRRCGFVRAELAAQTSEINEGSKQ